MLHIAEYTVLIEKLKYVRKKEKMIGTEFSIFYFYSMLDWYQENLIEYNLRVKNYYLKTEDNFLEEKLFLKGIAQENKYNLYNNNNIAVV